MATEPDHVLPADVSAASAATPGAPASTDVAVDVKHDPSLKPLLDGGTGQFLTPRQKIDRAVLYGLIVVVAGLGVGFVADKVATNDVAACTNSNLGARNAPNNADRAAQDAFDGAMNTLAQTQKDAILSGGNGPSIVASIVNAANAEGVAYGKYKQARKVDDAARAANPVGHC